MKNRVKSVVFNTVAAFGNEIVSVIAGFILPRFILSAYGSDVNGLVASIAQFLGFISFCEAGIGAVIKANLYKPLANNDTKQLSCIIVSSERFFRTIAYILTAYAIVLMVIFPFFISGFSWLYIVSLISITLVGFFSQYYFGVTNQLLLYADHRAYIPLSFTIIMTVLNTIISVVIIESGGSIHFVKSMTAVLFVTKPILLYLYVRKKYDIDRHVVCEGEPIKQKWNGFAQHLATIGQDNVSIMILTIFSTLSNVSIFAIYILVVNGIKQLIFSVNTSMSPIIGELLAKNEQKQLSGFFDMFEWVMHTVSVLLFTITGLLIVPFVMIYTRGITDANYNVPIFAYLLTIAICIRCLQICYNIVIQAAGHFRETQRASCIELLINIGISIFFVHRIGIIGVALGMLVSLIYRICYFAYYLQKNILFRPVSAFIKHCIVDVCIAFITIASCYLLIGDPNNYLSWTFRAIVVAGIATVIVIIVNYFLYKQQTMVVLTFVKKVFEKYYRNEKQR